MMVPTARSPAGSPQQQQCMMMQQYGRQVQGMAHMQGNSPQWQVPMQGPTSVHGATQMQLMMHPAAGQPQTHGMHVGQSMPLPPSPHPIRPMHPSLQHSLHQIRPVQGAHDGRPMQGLPEFLQASHSDGSGRHGGMSPHMPPHNLMSNAYGSMPPTPPHIMPPAVVQPQRAALPSPTTFAPPPTVLSAMNSQTSHLSSITKPPPAKGEVMASFLPSMA